MSAPVDLSETGMANGALALIGEPPISSLDDTRRKAARECKRHFAEVRDQLLDAKDWEFAKTQCTPPPLPNAPNTTYSYRYQMPSDCIRVLQLNDLDADDWECPNPGDDATTIVVVDTNALSPVIWYIRRVVNPAQWSNEFRGTFQTALAAMINPAVGRDKTLTVQLAGVADKKLESSARRDNQQRVGDTITSTTSWVSARWGYGVGRL